MSALPAATMMQWGAFAVDVDADGRHFRLVHAGQDWARFTLVDVGSATQITHDEDETEHSFELGGGARCAVRHSVDRTWTIRCAVSTPGSEPVTLPDPVSVTYAPGEGCAIWRWDAAAHSLIVVASRTGAAPVVALRVTHGWVGINPAPHGHDWLMALTPNRLRVDLGKRWVTSLSAEVYPSIEAVTARLPGWLTPLDVPVGQPWEFRDPDAAVVADPPAVTSTSGDVEQVSAPAGLARVTLHSARGATPLELHVAPSLDTLLAAGAARVLSDPAPVTPAGAFVLAEALGRSLVSDPSVGQRLLDEVDWGADADLLAIATAVGRGQRTGNPRLIRAALRRLRTVHPQVGYGRVVMSAWLAALALGLDAADEALALLTRPSGSDWAALELNVLHLRSVEGVGGVVAGLINALGGELPGEPVGLTRVQQARLVGLLQLCPEEWPMAPVAAACAIKNSRRLQAVVAAEDFDASDNLEILAWLALGNSLL